MNNTQDLGAIVGVATLPPRPAAHSRFVLALVSAGASLFLLHIPIAHASGDAADGSTTAAIDERYAIHWQANTESRTQLDALTQAI